MAASALAMAAVKEPSTWDAENVDLILFAGDWLYNFSISKLVNVPDYLMPHELGRNLTFFGKSLLLDISGDDICGDIYTDDSSAGYPNLKKTLENCKAMEESGILICNGYSVAVVANKNGLGIFDSHSNDKNGNTAPDGMACYYFKSVDEIFKILEPKYRASNIVYRQYQFVPVKINVQTEDNEEIFLDEAANESNMREYQETEVSGETTREEAGCLQEPEAMREEAEGLRESEATGESAELQEEIQRLKDLERNIEAENLLITSGPQNDNENEEIVLTSDTNMIVNMKWFLDKLHKVYDLHDKLYSCNFINLKLIKQKVAGLMIDSYFKCELCGLECKISNVPDDRKSINLNTAAVIGCQTIGIGFYQLEELLAILGVQVMSEMTWQKYSDVTAEFIDAANEALMKEAAEEEKRIAIENGRVVKGPNGEDIPVIAVEGDGSYSKRSYVNSKHDSPGCCVVIIGANTKKVIDLVVLQKNCSVCDYSFQQGTTPKAHNCVRNHGRDESSTSMEKYGFVKAFQRSFSKYGLIYETLISDGDSSNYNAILTDDPYRDYGVQVKNILCVNHIKRNISNGIKAVSKKPGCGAQLRDAIEKTGKAACEAIKTAVRNVNLLDCNWNEKVRMLRNCVPQLIVHLLGDHSNCQETIFECDGSSEVLNIYSEVRNKNLLQDYEACFVRVERNAQSLLHNLTTNSSESFNALIAKTIGAKRIDFTQKLQYPMRYRTAGISWNASETYEPICNAMEVKVPALAQKVQEKRADLNIKRNIRNSSKDPVEERDRRTNRQDKDYGRYPTAPDVSAEDMERLVNEHHQKLNQWIRERNVIEQNTRSQSESNDWHIKKRQLRIRMQKPAACSNQVVDNEKTRLYMFMIFQFHLKFSR